MTKIIDQHTPSIFDTKKDAEKMIDLLEEGVYCLMHNEYERPEYSVRRYKDGWGIHRETFYYQNTIKTKKSGRLTVTEEPYIYDQK